MKTLFRLSTLFLTLGTLVLQLSAPVLAQSATGPTITTQPTSITVAAGNTATFTVVANGVPPLSYQWAKGGGAIASATSATLTLNAVTASDAGSYAVTVSNSAGSVTSEIAALVVSPIIGGAPTITVQPTSQNVGVGLPVTFSVTATGTAPLTFAWFKDSRLLSTGSAPTLTLNAVTTADAGTYYVVISNVGGSITSSSATLTVAGPQSPGGPSALTSPVR